MDKNTKIKSIVNFIKQCGFDTSKCNCFTKAGNVRKNGRSCDQYFIGSLTVNYKNCVTHMNNNTYKTVEQSPNTITFKIGFNSWGQIYIPFIMYGYTIQNTMNYYINQDTFFIDWFTLEDFKNLIKESVSKINEFSRKNKEFDVELQKKKIEKDFGD